uniref:collagen-binding domain-containing protein n=1 Tax=Microbacterium halotolerans TaxID=246613 RepID=UPI00196963EE
MQDSARPSFGWAKHRRALFGAGATALVAGVIIAGASSSATAATETFNPFDVNDGFTIVSQGDVHLANGELEGSAAAFGSVSSGKQNGFPLLHAAAGEAHYTVPMIDGTPVRLLAERFSGSGGFDVSNRDDTGTIAADSPEANAVVKLVDVAGLTGSQRGGGVGNAAGEDFLRVMNADGGIIDLKTVPYEGSDVTDYATEQSTVSAYFGDVDAQVAHANTCLAEMYEPAEGLSNPVTVTDEGGLVYVEDFAVDMPNVIDYEVIAGKTIKLDRADGYEPTADAPLVVRVAPGTTDLGQLRFDGWSPQAGAQQSLSSHILLDLSEVSGSVTIDGLALGAIWAPSADLSFSSGVTANGQWFAGGDVTTAGGGEVHHHAFEGRLPCAAEPTNTDATDAADSTDATDAADGTDATDSTDAVDGADATDATDGADGTDATDGVDAADGIDAADGTDATDSTDAVDGADATDATDATDGADGTDATDGVDAADGIDAADGADGTDATDGVDA